jgi:protein phosphatase
MAQTFRDCCRQARQQAGTKGLLDLWIHTLYDLAITASTEQIAAGISLFKHLFGLEKEYTMSNYALNLDVALRTDVGRTRQVNQDAAISAVPQDPQVMKEKGALFVVADGLGGKGDVASEMAVNAVRDAYYQDAGDDLATSLQHAVQHANLIIYKANAANFQKAEELVKHGMGTTCVAAVLQGDKVYIANAGDSLAYIIRGGQVKQIAQDHSWVAEQVRTGAMTEEEAKAQGKGNLITRCLGIEADLEVYVTSEQVQNGDALVLCTDGLHTLVSEDELRTIVEQYGPQESVQHLVERANENGGPDNITAVVVRVSLEDAV